MAKNRNKQRKEELIAALNHKRESIVQRAGNLQKSVAANPKTVAKSPSSWLNPYDESEIDNASAAVPAHQGKLGAVQKLALAPLLEKASSIKGNLKLPKGVISPKAAKPILIGLGASVLIMSIFGARKRAKMKTASVKAVAKPAVGFLILKTALSVFQPALKQIVKNQVSKRS